jgi:hypothetical protein
MKTRLITVVLFTAITASALTVEQVEAIKKAVGRTPAPELPAFVAKLVQEAAPADRHQVKATALKAVASVRPGAVPAVQAALPAANRPPVTPGNTNGNRPTVPPGLKHDYGAP